MKYIIPIVLLIAVGCSTGPKESDLEKAGLNGKVMKLVERTSKAVMQDGKLVETNILSVDEYDYNESGFVGQWTYDVPAYYYKEVYEYDEKGHPINVRIIEGEDTSLSTCTFTLHKNGQIAVETWFDAQGKMEFHYDNTYKGDDLVETLAFDQEDSLRSIRRYSYNSDGLQDSVLSYTPTEQLQQYTAKTFQGKWIKESKVHAKQLQTPENLAMINQYDYVELDEQNNWVKAFLVTFNKKSNETVYRIIARDIVYY